MRIAFGVTWNDAKKAPKRAGAMALIAAAATLHLPVPDAIDAGRSLVSVIVRALPGGEAGAESAVTSSGGTVTRRLDIVNGFVADVPEGDLARLSRLPGIASLTRNRPVTLSHTMDGYDPSSDPHSMYTIETVTKATQLHSDGQTGQGVDVALIDSGVAPVNGLTVPGKIVNGPDLSFESQSANTRYLDTYGHGTHMAGIIAGRDDGFSYSRRSWTGHDDFIGMAPDARIVNVKVANAQGASDVSQILAAIDWVVKNRNSNGLNIRVMNLSFGTDGTQNWLVDPLSYAVDVAWRRGIFVVVAAGNNGNALGSLSDPAYNPRIMAVGATDSNGTPSLNDDTVPVWSSRGDGIRNPDIVAPGRSIQSLRTTNSFLDQTYPGGRINTRFFKGSGTSQAAAVVSGAAALMLQQRPELTPDQLKYILKTTATTLPAADPVAQGAGLLDLKAARFAPTPVPLVANQILPIPTGTGSLELARGSAHVSMGGVDLVGEKDIFGKSWNAATWPATSWNGTSWKGGAWNGATWSGASWSGASWSGASWSGATWSGASWSGASWSGASWS